MIYWENKSLVYNNKRIAEIIESGEHYAEVDIFCHECGHPHKHCLHCPIETSDVMEIYNDQFKEVAQ